MKRRLLTSADAVTVKRQHVNPCSDCPFARHSLAGWLAGNTAGWWLHVAHGDGRMECHTRKTATGALQCAGAAIYRSNVVKSVEQPNLALPRNTTAVFGSPLEFACHHSHGKIRTYNQVRTAMTTALNKIIRHARRT